MIYRIFALIFILSFSSCKTKETVSNNPKENTTSFKHTLVNPSEFNNILQQKNILIIDIRRPEEFNSGHLPDAINIDYESANFKEKLQEITSKKKIAIYCRSGRRSAASIPVFEKIGFSEVIELDGGINAWNAQNFKIIP